MRPYRSLAAKLVLLGSACLMLALASIGLTLWVTWQLEGGAAAVNEAGRLRMQTWRLAATLEGNRPAAGQALAAQIDDTLALLRSGEPARPLFVPWNDATRTQFTGVERAWQVLQRDWLGPPSAAHADGMSDTMRAQAEGFVAAVDGLVSAIEQQLSRWTAILNLFQLSMMALAIGSAVVLMYAGYVFVLDPVGRLKAGLQRLEGGDLAARVEVTSRDEFGALSDGFNRMAQTLQGLYQNLEDKVRDKTARLEEQRRRLAALYEASAWLAEAGTLDEMARGFVRQVRLIAGADAAAIRWSDEANERYLLLAGDCLPKAMAEDEHCLLTGQCLCGQPQAEARTKVIPIHPVTSAPLDNCARAGFETLVTVPVQLKQRILGELDLFYRRPASLSEEDSSLLDALASHLASAMESLRASALEREAAVAEERGLLARELHDSIAQSLAFLKIQVQLLRDAQRRADAAGVERVLGELDTGLRESTADVRELLLHFRTRTNTEDIEPALRSTLHKFELQTSLAAHLHFEGQGLPLDPDVQVQVLHVVQEALSNVRKHAQARAVWLTVQRTPQWRFEVRDDGHGFAPRQPDATHVGLGIMRERAARIGAQVTVQSSPGAGTCVVLTLPAPNGLSAQAA